MAPSIIVLMGLAGSGKGTQAERLVAEFGYTFIETGGLIRAKAKEDSPLGRRIKFNDDKGRHAPNTIITSLLIEALGRAEEQSGGAGRKPLLIDGFPRTLGQAHMLNEVLTYFDRDPAQVKALWIRVRPEQARHRLLNRAVCSQCKKVYPTREITICTNCGGAVAPRVYDTPAGIEERLSFFAEHTMEAIEFYKSSGQLVEVNGEQDIDKVTSDIKQALAL